MIKRYKTVLLVLLLSGALFTACSKPKLLSKETLADVYAELYLADQYIKINQGVNLLADSTLIYNAIFEHYGCTLEDYQYSIAHYISTDKAFPEIVDMAYKKVHKETQRLTAISGYNVGGLIVDNIFPKVEFPESIAEEELNNLKTKEFWKYTFKGDTIRPFDMVKSAEKLERVFYTNDGLYIGDPSKIVDDSDASGTFDSNPPDFDEDLIEFDMGKGEVVPPPPSKPKKPKGVNPADKRKDPSTEAKPLTKEELHERQLKLQRQREELRKKRQLKEEIEQNRKDRGYED